MSKECLRAWPLLLFHAVHPYYRKQSCSVPKVLTFGYAISAWLEKRFREPLNFPSSKNAKKIFISIFALLFGSSIRILKIELTQC